jgi:hypothetical protein
MKQSLEMVTIDEGMQIDSNDEHPAKADSPRIETLLPDSNLTDETKSQ